MGAPVPFRGNAEGLTNLTAVVRNPDGSPSLQVDLFRTEKGGTVFRFDYKVGADGVLERVAEASYPDLDAAMSALGAVIVATRVPDDR